MPKLSIKGSYIIQKIRNIKEGTYQNSREKTTYIYKVKQYNVIIIFFANMKTSSNSKVFTKVPMAVYTTSSTDF